MVAWLRRDWFISLRDILRKTHTLKFLLIVFLSILQYFTFKRAVSPLLFRSSAVKHLLHHETKFSSTVKQLESLDQLAWWRQSSTPSDFACSDAISDLPPTKPDKKLDNGSEERKLGVHLKNFHNFLISVFSSSLIAIKTTLEVIFPLLINAFTRWWSCAMQQPKKIKQTVGMRLQLLRRAARDESFEFPLAASFTRVRVVGTALLHGTRHLAEQIDDII